MMTMCTPTTARQLLPPPSSSLSLSFTSLRTSRICLVLLFGIVGSTNAASGSGFELEFPSVSSLMGGDSHDLLAASSRSISSISISSSISSVRRPNLARIVVDDFLWLQQQQQQHTDILSHGPLDEEWSSILDETETRSTLTTTLNGGRRRERLELAIPTVSSMNDDDSNGNMNSHHKYLSTGTTIAAVRGRDFVVLGADTRATAGTTVADTRATKIHRLADNCFCCGAGTSADLQHVALQTRHTVALQVLSQATIGNSNMDIDMNVDMELNTHNNGQQQHVPVQRVCRFLQETLYQQGGACQANLIVGGIFAQTPVLTAIHPHGSMDLNQPYTALGSGGLSATAVLESRYTPDLTLEQAVQLVQDAITAGISNDLGSGSQVDLCIMTAADGKVDYRRGVVPEEELVPVPKYDSSNDNDNDNETEESSDKKRLSAPGVNGFGNLPFGIHSRRVVAVHQSVDQEWNEYLGISSKE